MKHTTTAVVIVLICLAAAGVEAAAPRLNHDRRTPVVEVFEAARNAVVNISTTRLVSTRSRFFGFQDAPFDDIFQSPFLRRNVPAQSLGSGFLIHGDGYIVTNEHVVRRAAKITVSCADGATYPARVIAADPKHDMAILKMDPPNGEPLPALALGGSDDLMIGETVVAIGNPKGYRHSITAGVISALDRRLDFGNNVSYTGLIQTDASINPGNSGGPLLNINAEVIGINTAIRADAQGIGFAIAIDDFTRDLSTLLDFRRINRVVLGMKIRPDETAGGLVIDSVAPGGPAERAGAKAGQHLQAVDGRPADTAANFLVAMIGHKAGDTLAFDVRDGGQARRLTITLEARPKPDGAALARRWLGMGVQTVTPDLARRLRLPLERGILITDVADDGPAGQIGVQPRDMLFQIGGAYIADADDLGRVLEEVKPDQVLRVGIARRNVKAWTNIRTRSEP